MIIKKVSATFKKNIWQFSSIYKLLDCWLPENGNQQVYNLSKRPDLWKWNKIYGKNKNRLKREKETYFLRGQ